MYVQIGEIMTTDVIEFVEEIPEDFRLECRQKGSQIPTSLRRVVSDYDRVMTNCDHSIHEDLETLLKDNLDWMSWHFAYNFCGYVWYADGEFHEEVWVLKHPKTVVSAKTLLELMSKVNERFGSD